MFQFFINDEEVVCESNIQINEELMNPSSVELYKVYPKSWKGTNRLLKDYYFPKDYSKCKILKDGKLYFSGIVKNSADMELNPFKPHYCSLQILDPSILLSEGQTLDFVIVNKTVEEAILQVIRAISDYGFVVGNIIIPEEENTIIGAYSTLNKAPFDVFQYLSQVSQTRWNTRMIDEYITAIDFYDPELLDKQGVIEYTKDYFKKNKIQEIKYNYSTTDYRNKQIITSDEVFADITIKENIIATGYDTTFFLEQKIGEIKSIKYYDLNLTFATRTEKEKGVSADFYYEISSNKIETNKIYDSSTVITVEYVPVVVGREISYNTPEIQRINQQLGRNGTISKYENRNDVVNPKELLSISNSYIKYKGNAENTLSIVARTDFLKLGGKYRFNAPTNELSGNFLVKSKTTTINQNEATLQVFYNYELTNSFDVENELNYFDNQRAKNNGNISQGEYVSRNIDIESSVFIVFDNVEIKSIEISDNELNCTLSAPFIK